MTLLPAPGYPEPAPPPFTDNGEPKEEGPPFPYAAGRVPELTDGKSQPLPPAPTVTVVADGPEIGVVPVL